MKAKGQSSNGFKKDHSSKPSKSTGGRNVPQGGQNSQAYNDNGLVIKIKSGPRVVRVSKALPLVKRRAIEKGRRKK